MFGTLATASPSIVQRTKMFYCNSCKLIKSVDKICSSCDYEIVCVYLGLYSLLYNEIRNLKFNLKTLKAP